MNEVKRGVFTALVMLMATGAAMAQVTVPAGISSGIADAIELIGLVVALAGAGYIVIASAGVAWNVGAKFIKRLAGKA